MKIILKRLELVNFKGIRSLSVDFNEHSQNIMGANETGKSTIFNAFLWLLFGKDMEGRKDYEIKTTDENGREIPKIDHEVIGTFEIDSNSTVLRRILKEKWVKPRGAAEAVFSGNETEFFWCDVPCREKDYQEKINGIMKEDVFKLLTNPLYFNTGLTGYKIPDWQARRNVLLELAGKIDDKEIAAGDTRFINLLSQLKGKTLEEYRKQLAAQKKNVRERLEMIPARIDEATRAIPADLDFAAVERAILAKEKEIAGVDESMNSASAAQKARNNEQLGKQNDIFGLKSKVQTIEADIRSQFAQDKQTRESKLRELRAVGRAKDSELANLQTDKRRMEGLKDTIGGGAGTLRADWATVNSKQPDPQKEDCKCAACGQDLPADKIEQKNETYRQYVENFNKNKALRLSEITATGKDLATQVEGLDKSLESSRVAISSTNEEIAEVRKQIDDLEADSLKANHDADSMIASLIAGNEDRITLLTQIEDIERQILTLQNPGEDNADLTAQRSALVGELDGLKKQRNVKEQIAAGRSRVTELEKEERELAQQIVEVEGIEYVIQEFTRARIDILEGRVNHKFKHARFKLFDTQVNGQEVECCETTYKGVVFGTLNTAARVLVGIDIINTLSAHYAVSAPIFLDNRESVTVIPETDAQVINLIVSPNDKQLRVA